jgi:hypothetical protein
MLAQEVPGVAAPALDVHGAAEDERVVRVYALDVPGGLAVDRDALPAQHARDRLGDLGSRASLGGVSDQHLHRVPECHLPPVPSSVILRMTAR